MKIRSPKDIPLECVPCFVTLSNLFMGFVALVLASHDQVNLAAWFIVLALVWDTLDGNIARVFNVCSSLGRELDSLADMVSFIVAPAFLASRLLLIHINLWIITVLFVYLGAGAYRLARFNVYAQASNHFHGLPTPSAAIFLVMTMGAFIKNDWINSPFFPVFLCGCFLVVSFFMVSGVRYPKYSAIKFAKWKKIFYLTLGMFVLFTFLFNLETGLFSGIVIYIFLTPWVRHLLPSLAVPIEIMTKEENAAAYE